MRARPPRASSEGFTPEIVVVGLGPGDPELVTVKAARIIGAADVVAYHSARHGRSIARSIAEPYLRDGQIEEHLVYPVTTETSDHPGGYAGAMEDFYREAAERIAEDLQGGGLHRRLRAWHSRGQIIQMGRPAAGEHPDL